MTIADSLTLLNTTKGAIKTAIEAKGVTVGSVPFSQYATKIDDITTGGTSYVAWSESAWQSTLSSAWTRPSDWLTMPTVSDTEEKFVGLHAIYPNANFLAFTAAGDYTVDWGDGTVENFVSGATASHEYTYASISAGTISTQGYKQVLVTVTPQAGQQFTSLNLNVKYVTSPALPLYKSGWLDLIISGTNLSTLVISTVFGSLNVRHTTLERAQLISTTNISSFTYMFSACYSLKSVPVWVKSTAASVDMSNMFASCANLKTLNLFDTSNVTNMSSMFLSCVGLETIPFFDTSAATNTSSMFQNCYNLTSVPDLNLSSSTNLGTMFRQCYSLPGVSFTSNTGATATAANMFHTCNSLVYVNMPNTTNLQSAANMFQSCVSLTEIESLNTSQVTNMSSMFASATGLLIGPTLDTSQVTNMSSMFTGCFGLETTPLYTTTNVTSMAFMFNNCQRLTSVPLFDTGNVTTMANMFNTCSALPEVPLFNTIKVTTMANMFQNCNALISTPAFNTPALLTIDGMLASCANLKTISVFNTSNVTSTGGTWISSSNSLTAIPAFNFSSLTSTSQFAFYLLPSVTEMKMTGISFTFSVANCKLSASALNEIYTNLPTVTSKTITVTGNYGNTGDDPTIATAKGWTVTG